MANAENVSLIFYIASMLKTVKFVNPNERTRVCLHRCLRLFTFPFFLINTNDLVFFI